MSLRATVGEDATCGYKALVLLFIEKPLLKSIATLVKRHYW